jgi:hypothetical protein
MVRIAAVRCAIFAEAIKHHKHFIVFNNKNTVKHSKFINFFIVIICLMLSLGKDLVYD